MGRGFQYAEDEEGTLLFSLSWEVVCIFFVLFFLDSVVCYVIGDDSKNRPIGTFKATSDRLARCVRGLNAARE